MKSFPLRCVVIALCCSLSFACSNNRTSSATPPPTGQDHHHEHTAPHGGTLVALGEEFGHLELLLNKETGELTAYVLDGEAEKPVRLGGAPLELRIDGEDTLTLRAVADELTGETEEDSATYRGTLETLKGRDSFKAVISKVDLKGRTFENVTFEFPQGNEEEHQHDEEHEEHRHE